MKLAACYCIYKLERDIRWLPGLAVATEHGLSDVIAIFPKDGETYSDILKTVRDYRLYWNYSLYAPANFGQSFN